MAELSPILQFPLEIIWRIFDHVVEDHIEEKEWSALPFKPATVLASVCRPWRQAALGHSALWARIIIPPCSYEDIRDVPQIIRTSLERAATRPLLLRVYKNEWLPLVTSSSTQWHELHLYHPSANNTGLASVPGHIPNLHKLMFIVNLFNLFFNDSDDEDSENLGPTTAFSNAPHLREVDLVVATTKHIILPWAQLTHLRCRWQTATGCLQILQQTTNLQVLELAVTDDWQDNATVVLHHLRVLTVKMTVKGADLPQLVLPEKEAAHSILGHLTLPSLRHFTIELGPLSLSLTFVSQLIECSNFPLESLSLLGLGFKDELLAFAGITSLSQITVQLTLHRYDSEQNTYEIIERLATDATVFAALRELVFLPPLDFECSLDLYDNVVLLLQARPQLKRFHFDARPSLPLNCRAQTLQTLIALAGEGRDIRIHDFSGIVEESGNGHG
ncbi:hypothetical protein HMN09_00271300 [Mycena chlorophos]|uniref:F-box domain-containing protein n=1 Tax=Mycena chlorophos TaxID=658473 RepID=A0A8H6WIZ5_MYCCL|nr:hypothetical protein HMN09_00271300 [Mycena chlorophos]